MVGWWFFNSLLFKHERNENYTVHLNMPKKFKNKNAATTLRMCMSTGTDQLWNQDKALFCSPRKPPYLLKTHYKKSLIRTT